MEEKRRLQVNSFLAENLSRTVNQLVDFEEGVFVSVSRVEINKEAKMVRVFISCYPEEKTAEAIRKIYSNREEIIHNVAREMKGKRFLKMNFYPEPIDQNR